MNEPLTIRLGERLARALREESRRTGLPKASIVRQALEERLRATGKLSSLSVMRHYFGIMHGPVDLSSSRDYRQTWGRRSTWEHP